MIPPTAHASKTKHTRHVKLNKAAEKTNCVHLKKREKGKKANTTNTIYFVSTNVQRKTILELQQILHDKQYTHQ